MNPPTASPRAPRPWIRPATAGAGLAVWFVVLCVAPDPRPLSAPEAAIGLVRSLTGASEPVARVVTSLALRAAAFGFLGVLTSAALGGVAGRVAGPLGVVAAIALAVLSQWANYGHVPVTHQLKVSIPSAVVGALVGLALRGSRVAVVAAGAVVAGLFVWGTSTRTSADLDLAAGQAVEHLLSRADDIRPGDEGFADAVLVAFAYAEDNSHHRDPVPANRAAVLALGIVFGDEKVARIARREVEPEWRDRMEPLRTRVTLRGRTDLPRHVWVSAALVVLTDETRATAVGVGKELMDANPGGSGFSFVDLAANRVGILLALAATRDAESAGAFQTRVIAGGLRSDDYCPEIEDLPEGLTRDQFQSEFGGLGGRRTRDLRAAIERRLATRPILVGDR